MNTAKNWTTFEKYSNLPTLVHSYHYYRGYLGKDRTSFSCYKKQSTNKHLHLVKKTILSLLTLCLLITACKTYQVPLEGAPKIRQIYLTNEAAFIEDSKIKYLGSAFLIEYQKQVFACTAKHIVEKSKRINPPIKTPKVNEALQYWHVFPRKKEQPIIELDSLLNDEKNDSEWWLFAIKKRSKKIQTLEVRFEPVQKGEKVFFVGCPYTETECQQNIYIGEVHSISGNLINLKYEPHTNVAGFSGAPLLDAQGRLIGLLTKASFDKNKKVHTRVTAESTAYLQNYPCCKLSVGN